MIRTTSLPTTGLPKLAFYICKGDSISLEEFRNIAEGVQSLLIGGAVVFGGGWALTRLGILNEVERSKLDMLESKQQLAAKKGFRRTIETIVKKRTDEKCLLYGCLYP